MYVLYAIFAIVFGILGIKYPKKMLEIGHIFTVKSGRTIFGGVISLFGGIILFIYAIANM